MIAQNKKIKKYKARDPNRPSMPRAIRMKCYDCMGKESDGKNDCEIRHCPLYYWQKHRKFEPDMSWAQIKMRKTKEKKELESRQVKKDEAEQVSKAVRTNKGRTRNSSTRRTGGIRSI